jgi:hypothetical protein
MVSNGQLAAAALGYVSGHRVRADLVPQTAEMIAAARRDGVNLRITQGYRTLAEQVSIFRERYTTTPLAGRPYRIWNGVRWYQRPGTAVAAVPGTSNHGLGQAIDFATDSPGALVWLAKHGAKYGWSRPAWTYRPESLEPWHHEATLVVLVSNPGTKLPTAPPVPVIPTPPELDHLTPLEDDMPTLLSAPGCGTGLLDGGVLTGIGDQATIDAWAASGVKHLHITGADYLRHVRSSTSTWVLYCPPAKGGRGYAVWSGGRAVGLGEKATVDAFTSKGATLIEVSGDDFDRFVS